MVGLDRDIYPDTILMDSGWVAAGSHAQQSAGLRVKTFFPGCEASWSCGIQNVRKRERASRTRKYAGCYESTAGMLLALQCIKAGLLPLLLEAAVHFAIAGLLFVFTMNSSKPP